MITVNQPPWVLRSIVEKILPRGVRREYMRHLDRYCKPVGDWLRQCVIAIAAGYLNQAVAAFDKVAFPVRVAAMVFCLSAAATGRQLFFVLGVIVATMLLRDAFTHPGTNHRALSRVQYALTSGGDAALVAFTVLGSQILMRFSPLTAMPSTPLLRGLAVSFPILMVLRMVHRPRFDQKLPFEGSELSAEAIFRRTWGLNILWMMACMNIITTNPDSLPAFLPDHNFYPNHDFLKTFLPMTTFQVWLRFQVNGLNRKDRIETLFVHWKKKRLIRWRELLLKGMEKREPFYRGYVVLEVAFFLYLAIPLATHLWPWLAGGKTDSSVFIVFSNLVMWSALLCSWNYLKAANRAAADALQQKIDNYENLLQLTRGLQKQGDSAARVRH